MSKWLKKEVYDLTKENIDLLLEQKIPAILVKDFIPNSICLEICRRLKDISFGSYDHLNNIPVHQLGVCHNEFAHEDKNIYFDKIPQAQESINKIYAGLGIDPVNKLIDILAETSKREVGIYEEDGYGKYFAGAFRSFRGHGKLHADHAPSHITAEWSITKLIKQLTWNIYYCLYDEGGEVIIYETVHTQENDKMKVKNEYYFPYEVLENKNNIKVFPNIGDLLIFNTQNFHEIMGHDKGSRISQTSFIGLTPDGDLNLWS